MKRLALALAVVALLGAADSAAAADPGPVHQCGTFVSYRAADSTRSGELVIGSTAYATSSGNPAPFRQVIDPRATIGSQVCLDGTVVASQTTANLLTDFTVSPAPPCTSSVGPAIPPPTSVPSGIHYFHASWYGQSGYPTLCPGETSTATVAYYNSGEFGWVSGRMNEMAFLGTWEPEPGQDRPSTLGGDGTNGSPSTGWPRYNRAAAQPAAYVGPGQIAWFQFTIKAPMTSGTYRVYIRPLIEGTLWMEDAGVFWQVTVKGPGEEAVIVDTVNVDAHSFTAGSATFRYDANDAFQYLGAAITFAQFEQTLSRGDSVGIRYETDPARSSTFNITRDLGREAPTITGWTGNYQGGAKWNIGLTMTEPPTNQDGLGYSLQRALLSQRPSSCSALTGPYAEIATVIFATGSNDAAYTDTNLPDGIYCYRIGTPNSVTATRFGYSAPASLFSSPR
jgi:hypothetical protein